MRSGGAEKSLLTVLTLFDYEKYEVDLLCFRHDGLFFEKIPKEVNIIGGSKNYEIFDGDAVRAVKFFLKKGKILSGNIQGFILLPTLTRSKKFSGNI